MMKPNDLKEDAPAKPNDTVTNSNEAELTHRHMERDAMKGAKRAKERERRDEANDEFTGIGTM